LVARNALDVTALRTSLAAAAQKPLRELAVVLPATTTTQTAPTPTPTAVLCLSRLSITDVAADAIVNAANETLEGGGGVDGAIHAAAGPGLKAECLTIAPVVTRVAGGALEVGERVRCPVGEARVTAAHQLKNTQWVIHTVAPLLDAAGKPQPELLRACYVSALEAAAQRGCVSVAFCALGTGFYGYPLCEATEVALTTVLAWLQSPAGTASTLRRIVFCTFGDQADEVYAASLGQLAASLNKTV
jgi:O-acetyl-ADP-ribose deacetylase (regulator of RNase III)